MQDKMKREILLAYQILSQSGLCRKRKGSVSIIDREKNLLVYKNEQGIFEIDIDCENKDYSDLVTSDVRSHILMYQNFHDIRSIVHPYAKFATVFSQVGLDIPVLGMFHKEVFAREIICVDDMCNIKRRMDSENISPVQTPAALLLSCGGYTWGNTAFQAVDNAILLEEVAELAWFSLQLDPGLPSLQR